MVGGSSLTTTAKIAVIVALIIGLIIGIVVGPLVTPPRVVEETLTVTATGVVEKTLTVTATGVVEKTATVTVGVAEAIPEKYRKIMEQLPEYYPQDYWKIIQAAEKEGELLIYSIMSVENWAPVLEGFNKLYPFIKVSTLDLGSYEVFDRYLAESAAGATTADMIISTAPDVFPVFIKEHGIKYVSPEATFYPTGYILDWKLYAFDATPSLMVYNKLLLPADRVPDGFASLAEMVKKDPTFWEGKITTYDVKKAAFGCNMAYFFTKKNGDRAWGWLKDIGRAKVVTYSSSGTMLEKIAAGEHLIGFFISRMSLMPRLEKAPELYGVIYPKEGVPVALRTAVITKNARHPNAAKLMLDYMLSRAGQVAWARGGLTPVRPDIADIAPWSIFHVAKEVGEENIIPWEFAPEIRDPEFVEQFKERFMVTITGGTP